MVWRGRECWGQAKEEVIHRKIYVAGYSFGRELEWGHPPPIYSHLSLSGRGERRLRQAQAPTPAQGRVADVARARWAGAGKIVAKLIRAGPAAAKKGWTTSDDDNHDDHDGDDRRPSRATPDNDGRCPRDMMASPTPGLTAALRGVSKALRRPSEQPLEQQLQALRLGPAAVVPGRRRCMATESGEATRPDANSNAADPFGKKLSGAELANLFSFPKHARPLPVSRAYFSRTPIFSDRFVTIHKLSVAYAHLPLIPPSEAERVSWKSLADVKQSFAEPVKATDYARCLHLIRELHRIHPGLRPPDVEPALQDFKREVQANVNVARPIPIDPHGRSIGVGRRKASTASAFLVEGDGQVLINGKSLADYFGRVHDRESAIWALHATDRVNKYNVWARVEGGGTTGQAEALTLAISQALIRHEPALKAALRRGEFCLPAQQQGIPFPPPEPLIRHSSQASKRDMRGNPRLTRSSTPQPAPSRATQGEWRERSTATSRPERALHGSRDSWGSWRGCAATGGAAPFGCASDLHDGDRPISSFVGTIARAGAGRIGLARVLLPSPRPPLCKPFSVSTEPRITVQYNKASKRKRHGRVRVFPVPDHRRLRRRCATANGRAMAELAAVPPPLASSPSRRVGISGIKRPPPLAPIPLPWLGWFGARCWLGLVWVRGQSQVDQVAETDGCGVWCVVKGGEAVRTAVCVPMAKPRWPKGLLCKQGS